MPLDTSSCVWRSPGSGAELDPTRSRTRPTLIQIQALRAIAVTLVVVYHFWPDRVTGGFVGVDVFFVISGYLITGHLLREVIARGTISLPAFYARRARRLLPASALVLIVVSVMVLVWLPILRWTATFREILASGLYFQNWNLVAQSTDYLAADNAASPVQHYWSLSTEEQFYLIWPVIMLLAIWIARRRCASRRTAMLIALAVIVVGSYVYSVVLTGIDPSVAYFSTFTHAWEFGAGGLLAISGITLRHEAAHAAIVSWLGIALIVGSALVLTGSTPFPGWIAAVPVIGTVLVIVAGMPEARWSPRFILGLRPVRFVGDVSYSVYLWHWPFVVLGPFIVGTDLSLFEKVGFIALSILLAWLTKILVEDPARQWRALTLRRPRWSLLSALGVMIVVALVAGGGDFAFQQRLNSVEAGARPHTIVPKGGKGAVTSPTDLGLTPNPLVAGTDRGVDESCWSIQTSAKIIECHYHEGTGSRVALIGDSHAQALSIETIALAKQRGWRLDTYLKQACSWASEGAMLKAGAGFASKCGQWRTAVQKKLLAEHYDAIITTSSVYRVKPTDTAAGMAAVWKPMVASGTHVYTLLDNPTWPTGDPNECLIKNHSDSSKCTETRKAAFPWPDPQLVASRMVPQVHVIDQTLMYCSATTCFSATNGYDMYRDEEHFTGTYAKSLTAAFGANLSKLGLRN